MEVGGVPGVPTGSIGISRKKGDTYNRGRISVLLGSVFVKLIKKPSGQMRQCCVENF